MGAMRTPRIKEVDSGHWWVMVGEYVVLEIFDNGTFRRPYFVGAPGVQVDEDTRMREVKHGPEVTRDSASLL
jgi:hypothetical protein